jgi:signal transduction histidine kinase
MPEGFADVVDDRERNGQAGVDAGCVARVTPMTPRTRVDEEVRRVNVELRKLSGDLLRSQDQERRRIARDLHDSTVQLLCAIAMNLTILKRNGLPPERAKKLIASSQALARQCSQEIRTISYLLHPPLLDELGLTPALEEYAAGFRERTGIDVHLDISPDLGRLGADTETTLFRIVQEGLANVHRHSGARRVAIRLERREREVILEVADDGRGFPEHVLAAGQAGLAKLGVGILGMRERASQLGGKLMIESGPGGARIRATLALEESNGDHSSPDRR